MKMLQKLSYCLLLTLIMCGCAKNFDGPLLDPPTYGGTANITVAELKSAYASVATSALIEENYVLRGIVIGNDKSGNIYKQLYIRDETGAINIGIDQNSIFATHNIGQEVFIDLKGLAAVKYGGELQIGFMGTNANRIPWLNYQEYVHFNGFPDASKVAAQLVELNGLNNEMVNTLIHLQDIYFVNGGVRSFVSGGATTDEAIKDVNGNSIIVRTSSYSDFANDLLPKGTGALIGVLGRYNGAWQLILRDRNDVLAFDGKDPEGPIVIDPNINEFFKETFGVGTYASGSRPKIADFTDFDMKAPCVYADASGNADVRTISGIDAHVWFTQAKDTYLTITGINTSSYPNAKLSFQVAANLYNPTDEMNLNTMEVTCDGVKLTTPGTPVSNAAGDRDKYYTFVYETVPSSANLTIEFKAVGVSNTYGVRLDNIKLFTGPTPAGAIILTK